jgi:hypothetical protein
VFEVFVHVFADVVVDGLEGEHTPHDHHCPFPETAGAFARQNGLEAIADGLVGSGDAAELHQLDVGDHAHFDDFEGGVEGGHAGDRQGLPKDGLEHDYY